MLETVYEHCGKRSDFTVTAAERWSIAMIKRLKAKYPDQVEICCENQDGSVVAHIPFEWMRIVPKKQVNMSEERKAELSERMRNMRSASTNNG